MFASYVLLVYLLLNKKKALGNDLFTFARWTTSVITKLRLAYRKAKNIAQLVRTEFTYNSVIAHFADR